MNYITRRFFYKVVMVNEVKDLTTLYLKGISYLFMLKKVTYFILLLFIFIPASSDNAFAWWDSSWSYRKPITITNTGSALTDYQILINDFDTATLVSAGKMQSNGNDIRFANSSDIELSYWIERGMNTSATDIWVKVDSIAGGGDTTIYMYYGNSSASAASNGRDTFIVWDDFASATEQWTEVDPNSHIEIDRSADERLEFTDISQVEDAYVYMDLGAGAVSDFLVDFDIITPYVSSEPYTIDLAYLSFSNEIDDLYNTTEYIQVHFSGEEPYIVVESNDGGYSKHSVSGETIYYVTFTRIGTDVNLKIYSDSARTNLLTTGSITQSTATTYRYIYALSSWNSNHAEYGSGWIDNIKYRKYTSSEPSVGAPGSEETIAFAHGGSYDGYSVGGTTSDVAVGFGTATKVAFTQQPSGAVAGAAFTTQPVVAIQDTYGNTVLTATDDVTVSISNDPTEGDKATLSGTTTVAASSGEATFTDLSIDEPGVGYTLQAASGALTTDTSSTFNVGGAPWVTSVSALQLTDGSKKVQITYTAYDLEGDSCNVTAAATQAQYSQDNTTWNNATLSDTSTTTGITATSDGVVHSDLYWEAGTDLNNTEDSTVYFRLKLNDGTYTSPSYSTTSSAFVLDTKAPVISSATSFSSTPQAGDTTITLTSTWTDSNYSSAVSYFYYALDGETYSSANAGTSGSLTPSATIDLGTTLTGHSYFSKIKSTLTDDYGNTSTSEDTTDVGVVPYKPPAPTVQNQKQTSLDVIVNKNASEASGLEYAIYILPAVDGYHYVQTDGSVGASAAWQTISDWGTKTVVGLAKETVYSLKTKSRNADVTSVESDWSNTASLSTLSAGMTFALGIDYLYDVSNDAIKFLVWLTLGGEKVVCTSSDTAVVNIYDSSGTKLNSSALTSSSPDAQGTFSLTWDPADGTGFTTDVNYYAQAQITHGGATYYDTLTFNINEAKRISEILTDTGTTLPATLTTIEGKIDTIDTIVDAILVDTGTDLPTAITTAKTDIIAELDKGPKAKILNRPTTVKSGETITIRYKTDSGLSPVIDVYDADNTKRVNAASMTEIGSTGIYEYDLTLSSSWGTGDFTVICSESTKSSIDSILLTVASAAITDLSSIDTKIDTIDTNLDTVNTNVSSIKTIVGTTSDTSSSSTLYGKLAGVTSNVSSIITKWGSYTASDLLSDTSDLEDYIGTPDDTATDDTIFGKIAQIYNTTGTISTASTYAQNAYNEIQQVRAELDFNGKTDTAYNLMVSLKDTLSELRKRIDRIPSEVATPSPDKIATSLAEAFESLKAAAAGYPGIVHEIEEVKAEAEGEEVVDLTTLKNQLSELKALVEIIKGLIIEKEEKPVIKSWFEMG